MGFAAFICIFLGVLGLIWGAMQKYKAGRLAKAPFVNTQEVAESGTSVEGPKGEVSVEGKVNCPEPLISPVTGTECLYYELEVEGTWKDGDSTKSKKYVEEKFAAPFSLDDGSGGVPIHAAEGGDFDDLEETFSETKKEGFFADLKNAVGKKEPIMFGVYAFENPPMSKANKFKCTEKVLKVQSDLFVMGRHQEGVITAPKWTSLVLSSKSRDELLGSTAKAAKNFLIGGGAFSTVGAVLAIVAAVIGGPEPADAATVAEVRQPEVVETIAMADTAETAEVAPAKAVRQTRKKPKRVSKMCRKAMSCCEAASGGADDACLSLAQASTRTCKTSLKSFKKAVRKSNPKKIRACR